MSTLNNKIECIRRLIRLDNHHELVQWMIDFKLLSRDSINANIKSEQNMSELIYLTLKRASDSEQIILLDYEWTILPRESIKILIVTERESRSFTYGL
jgi:hypothetical protein